MAAYCRNSGSNNPSVSSNRLEKRKLLWTELLKTIKPTLWWP
jgi:hypothetical protein